MEREGSRAPAASTVTDPELQQGRLWNPLEWGALDRCLLWFALVSPWPLLVWLVLRHALHHPELLERYTPFLDVAFLEGVLEPFFRAVYLAAAVILGGIIVMRRRSPHNRLLVHATLQLYSIYSAAFIYFTGTVTTAFWCFFATGAVLLLILFEARPVLLSMLTAFVITCGSLLATEAGWAPYAPAFHTSPHSANVLNAGTAAGVLMLAILWAVTALFCGVLLFVVTRWQRRERQVVRLSIFLRQIFGRYLPAEVVRTLIRNPESLKLGGEKRRVTLMMTDLRGFTAISERLDAEQVVAMLNRYLRVMMEICKRYGGTVNDIQGDGLLITFGAPVSAEDHARRAVACAIEMQNAMHGINEENERQQRPRLDMGIALNTTEVVIGNIGSEERAKFGVIGNGVNMTARIESYTVGGQILASETVLDEAGEVLRVDRQRTVRPKGARGPLTIHEIGAIAGPYQLVLEWDEPPPATLARPIPARMAGIEDKHETEEEADVRITALSPRALCVQSEIVLHGDENVRIRLVDHRPHLSRPVIYGKVTAANTSGAEGTYVRLTYLPPEIVTYFEGIIDATLTRKLEEDGL